MEEPSLYYQTGLILIVFLNNLFNPEVIISLLSIIILLIFSGLISGSEIAFFSLSPSQKSKIFTDKSQKGERIVELLNKPNKLLAGILISNNFINISIILLSTYVIQNLNLYSNNPILTFLIQVILITFLILLFGEIIPKIYATRRPLEIVYLMEKTHFLLQIIFKPFIYLLVKPTEKIDKTLEKRNKGNISMMELSDAVDLANQDDKNISPDEQKILKGITTFRDKEVKDIMTSRPDIISIDISADFQQVLDIINKEGYSRIPVYKDSLDEVKGILYIKDLLPFINKEEYNWNEIIRSAYFVPESKKINDLFQEFKLKRIHIAVVVDEYGGTSGIISLEDVIEEIFGEIGDEFDNISSEIKFTNPKENEWIFEAKTSINDLCKLIDEDDSYFENVRGDADSLGGLFLEINQHFPNVNDKVVYKEYTLIIVSKTERKIDKIKIIKK